MGRDTRVLLNIRRHLTVARPRPLVVNLRPIFFVDRQVGIQTFWQVCHCKGWSRSFAHTKFFQVTIDHNTLGLLGVWTSYLYQLAAGWRGSRCSHYLCAVQNFRAECAIRRIPEQEALVLVPDENDAFSYRQLLIQLWNCHSRWKELGFLWSTPPVDREPVTCHIFVLEKTQISLCRFPECGSVDFGVWNVDQ